MLTGMYFSPVTQMPRRVGALSVDGRCLSVRLSVCPVPIFVIPLVIINLISKELAIFYREKGCK